MANAPRNAYFAVNADRVVALAHMFEIKLSTLAGGEKKLFAKALNIHRGRDKDRWGHHTEGVIRKFCHHAQTGGVGVPWQELVEDRRLYDDREGIAPRTGNVPLATTSRHHVDAGLIRELLANGTPNVPLPRVFSQALADGSWPTISEETARQIEESTQRNPRIEPSVTSIGHPQSDAAAATHIESSNIRDSSHIRAPRKPAARAAWAWLGAAATAAALLLAAGISQWPSAAALATPSEQPSTLR